MISHPNWLVVLGLGAFLSVTAFAESTYTCTASADFCMSSETVTLQTQSLEEVCAQLYLVSAADTVSNVQCRDDQSEQTVLKLNFCP